MTKSELEKGKALAEEAMKWWGSTLPSFNRADHKDEPIPVLNQWLHDVAFPALEKGAKNVSKNKRNSRRA